MSNAGRRLARWRAAAFALTACAWAALAGAATSADVPTTVRAASAPAAKPSAPIDVNSASRAQLKTLPGIGEAEAERIIAGRPYRSKADLVEHGVIPQGVYLSIKGRIMAKQKTAPVAKRS